MLLNVTNHTIDASVLETKNFGPVMDRPGTNYFHIRDFWVRRNVPDQRSEGSVSKIAGAYAALLEAEIYTLELDLSRSEERDPDFTLGKHVILDEAIPGWALMAVIRNLEIKNIVPYHGIVVCQEGNRHDRIIRALWNATIVY